MNFDEAIAAHGKWKQTLSQYLRKPDGSVKIAEIAVDNKCPLGKWIHGEGAQHSKLPEYGALKTNHARFHKAAAEVVRKADSGQPAAEETTLGSRSEFGTASSAVVIAIMNMKKHLAT
jgi:Chemoreceptor zinc-binding domain